MKVYWKDMNQKKVRYVRHLGATIPGQPKTTHQVSLPNLVYFIYATAKEDLLKARPILNKSNNNNIQNTCSHLVSLLFNPYAIYRTDSVC